MTEKITNVLRAVPEVICQGCNGPMTLRFLDPIGYGTDTYNATLRCAQEGR
jgi:hypothetical protein